MQYTTIKSKYASELNIDLNSANKVVNMEVNLLLYRSID